MSWDENREGVPALGARHPRDRCCRCNDRRGPHVVGVHRDTRARALFCENVAACERRVYQRRQLELFGPEPAPSRAPANESYFEPKRPARRGRVGRRFDGHV